MRPFQDCFSLQKSKKLYLLTYVSIKLDFPTPYSPNNNTILDKKNNIKLCIYFLFYILYL